MKGLRFLTAVWISLFVGGAVAFGLEPVYVVDVQKIINESIIGKAARTNVEAEIKKREGPLKKLQNDLEAMRKDLEKQSGLLSAEALRSRRVSMEAKERELQESFQKSRGELAKLNNEQIARVVKEIEGVVRSMAADKDHKIVLEKDSRFVVYADPEFDLTSDVLKALDARKLDS